MTGPGSKLYILILCVFSVLTAVLSYYLQNNQLFILACIEAGMTLFLIVFFLIFKRKRQKELEAYIESLTYETENAKDNTLMNFPLPIAVFRLDDSRIIWGNQMFFDMCGSTGKKFDARISDLLPDFSGKWLMEGKTQYPSLLTVGGRKYRIHGNIVRPEDQENAVAFMGITYWIDVTEYDDTRIEYEESRPVAGIIVVDNLEEMYKNQPDRVKNDIRDSVEDKLSEWAGKYNGICRRFDRDRYIAFFEKRNIQAMKDEKFSVVEEMHTVETPAGINASISIGLGEDAANFSEALQFAEMATELALTRGGDQAVIKNKLSFEFFGGRGLEVEKRTKVRSRVMANTLKELIKDSSRVLVMGHRYADLDAVGSSVGICCLARKYGIKANIIIDDNNAAGKLIDMMKKEPEYKTAFISSEEAMLRADGHTLLVVLDTNRPEQVQDVDILQACNRVAVIDHHRVSATYIHNAALGYIEPYASSCCELVTEILQELGDPTDMTKAEAEAVLSGIVLDTKSFTIRTGDRTFDAAAYLRRCGADTTDVKKLLQSDMDDTISKYKILQTAELYRNVAIAVPTEAQSRIVAAQAADELLNISGVDASIVISPNETGGVFASARSIGELNVQIIMEKLGGGGNRSAAAAQFNDIDLAEAVSRVYKAIDDYLG